MIRKYRKWIVGLLCLFGAVMLWLLLGRRWGQWSSSWNLKPLDTVRRFLWVLHYSSDPNQLHHAVVNLAGNVIMFVPLGFLPPCLWQKMRKFWLHFLVMVGIILIVELLQLVLRLGTFDIDDLFLNLMGTTLGFSIWLSLYKWQRRSR